ncbi:MAG TPA: MBL fold metallo-hydrolase [Longimicrobium sp.]|nr:MBL fold metallo-hydrolase [Longimicrobium sp.]
MLFRQLFDAATSSYTYLLADEESRQALLIDPVFEQVDRDLQLLKELGLVLVYTLETHVHADHITGAAQLAQRTGARLVAPREGGPVCAEVKVWEGDVIELGSLSLRVLSTPGHTCGCVSYAMEDRVFTGDALLIRTCGRTDFQGGDPSRLYDSITRKLFALPDETLVFPAHDYKGQTVSTIGEEKRFNVRAAGRNRDQFVELMRGLKLALPKRIHEAVPANLAGGWLEALPLVAHSD